MNDDIADKAQKGGELLGRRLLKPIREVPIKCTDDEVDIARVKRFFKPAGWMAVQKIVQDLTQEEWTCEVCADDISLGMSVGCDVCLSWLHLKCAGLSAAPKKKTWVCRACYL